MHFNFVAKKVLQKNLAPKFPDLQYFNFIGVSLSKPHTYVESGMMIHAKLHQKMGLQQHTTVVLVQCKQS